MKLSNKLLIKKINQAINSYNEDTKEEQIELIKNGNISYKDLEKISTLYIDVSDIQEDEKEKFFEELGKILENMKLSSFYLYSENENKPIKADMAFLSKFNKELKILEIQGVDLSGVDANVFNRLENLQLLILGNNNINDLTMLSQLNENLAIDVGKNNMNNVSINDVVKEINKHHGKMAFNEHPYLNSIVFALKDKKIDLSNIDIPENKMNEIFQFIDDYGIKEDLKTLKIEDYIKINENRRNHTRVIISGTKDISTAFLEEHPEIVEVQIIDEENRESDCQEEPYTREDFFKIRQKIDEIKGKIEIPDISDENREKKIFMQVYNVLGKMIDYNHYAVTEEGRKDSVLRITCRNLKDGLLKRKAVCAGYADILKNILGEFGIRADYIGRDPENIEKYAERMGYAERIALDESLGLETMSIEEFAKMCGYKDEAGHAWNSVELDGKKYLCDLTWDADNIKLEHFPLEYCCSSLEEFNSVGSGELTHDMFVTVDEGEISEFSSEDQLRFLGFSEEEIERKLHPSLEDLLKSLEQLEAQQKIEAATASIASEIKASDFDGIEKVFDDRKEKEQMDYVK